MYMAIVVHNYSNHKARNLYNMLQDVLVEDRLGPLSLFKSVDSDCLCLVEFHLNLNLYLHSVINW